MIEGRFDLRSIFSVFYLESFLDKAVSFLYPNLIRYCACSSVDRASASEAEGRRFESSQAHQ